MKIVIAGANGFLGRAVGNYFVRRGHEVVGLVRTRGGVAHGVREVSWDGETPGAWAEELEGSDVLVNFAGRSVNCRYGKGNRAAIHDSRVASTRILGDALAASRRGPGLWINSSTATIYRHAEDRPMGEYDGELGSGFSVEVAKAWEKAFFGSAVPGQVRKVALRTALVLGREPGTVFSYLWKLARSGLGGRMGRGCQMVSWIHADDFCRLIDWLIVREDIEGVINAAAPRAVSNRALMVAMREAAERPFGFPASRWMLEVGAWALGTETELILKSRWVAPRRLLAEGFSFRWSTCREAIGNLAAPPALPGRKKGRVRRTKTLSRHVS